MSSSGLRTPPKLRPDTLRIIPLGGLGDVGRNMASLEINGKILIIDCGVLFPSDDHPGVDLILPGIDVVRDRLDDVVGLVLTHGHEDHIGAVPYLLQLRNDIPVFGTRLTLALVREKLRERRVRNTDLREIDGDSVVNVEEFEIEFIPVNHSIPDAVGLFLRTKAGTVLHTGDFKMDQLPLDGRLTDLRRFAKLGEEGVDLFMVDSTNAEVPGFTTPEKDIQPALQRVFSASTQRLVVACFASHVHRVQQVLDEAVRHGRKVAYVGRSMLKNMAIARDLGYLQVPGNTLIELKDVENYRPSEVVIVSTGSQGEPLSALSRMANREHPQIELQPGDTVLLASSLIPGNENSVSRVINGLSRLGAKVVHKGNALVHVSGHASAGELLYCYNIVKPRNVVPVHGEMRHLIANADLAQATGVPAENTLVIEDGEVVDMHDGRLRTVGRIDTGYVFVDGSTVGALSDTELTDRRILGDEGFITVIAVVNPHTAQLITGPDIHARGFVEDDSVFNGIRDEIAAALVKAMEEGVDDTHRLQQVVRRQIGRWVNKSYRRRPMIVPVVIHG
ncbi:MAG TPA: ribonuclease J [Propionibacterium sp.]|jgi:ribonuclease J|nr:ribonuclease J [Propionibacterium sp.]